MKTYFKYEGIIKSKEAAEAIAAPSGLGPFCGFGSATINGNKLVVSPQGVAGSKYANVIKDRIMARYMAKASEDGELPDVNFGCISRDGYVFISDEQTLTIENIQGTQGSTEEVLLFAVHTTISEPVDNPVDFVAYWNESSESFYTLFKKSLDIYYPIAEENRTPDIINNDVYSNYDMTYSNLLEMVESACPYYSNNKTSVVFSAEHPDVRPETAEFLTLLREQTERLTQMTKTLLEMSNLQQVARNERIQLAPMVEEIFTDLAPLAEKRSITLDAAGDAVLTGSDALIYRLLFNLTENAVKYNRPGGSVRVKLAQGQEKCIIRVSDTGCGIPEEYQRSIFHPFFRVDKSRSREYGGAGLGLSLVWEIANLHGGSVWVEESSDKGTTIAVELPAGAENDSPGADIL